MTKILLIKLSDAIVYKGTKVETSVPQFPSLGLATIAGCIRESGHNVKILDYTIYKDIEDGDKELDLLLRDFSPDYVGMGFTTVLFNEMVRISNKIKAFNPEIKLIGGGAHPTNLPEETLKTSPIDIVVLGEGDFLITDVINTKNLHELDGVGFKESNEVFVIPKKIRFLDDLDKLPFPAWDLFEIEKYHTPKQMCRKNPVGLIETSRGCLYGCVFCTKTVFGYNFRSKSAKRTVDEMEFMIKCGFKEIQIAEDMFTTNKDRVMEICNMIVDRGLKFPWATYTGIRVDSVNLEMLKAMKKAGCYRVYYGFESGNDEVLKKARKGITVEQSRNAVKWSKEAKLEVFGFFLIALPDDTESTMQDTINLAKSLDLNFAKVNMLIPLPGTAVWNDYKKRGLLKNVDWDEFKYYTPPSELYTHPNVDWATIEKYYKKFYKEFYFRPNYIAKKLVSSIRHGTIIEDVKAFKNTKWS